MSKMATLQRKLDLIIRYTPGYNLVGSAAATAANHPLMFWIAPVGCRLDKVLIRYSAAGGSGATIQLRKAASGTAMGSGTAITAAQAVTGTADTLITVQPTTTNGVHILKQGDAIGVVTAGTLTGLADLSYQCFFVPLELDYDDNILGV